MKVIRALKFTQLIQVLCAILLALTLSGHVLAQSAQIQGPRDNAQVFSGVVYGPIDQSDTLWRIASRYKQDNQFSVYQVMMAIYELNQQAFENGNFNTMVNGATLRLPSDRYIARIDPQRARAKAEQDDRLFGRPNSVPPATQPGEGPATNAASANLKPEVPLVNQEDLSNTQSQLQSQLNGLRRQQEQQFEALKNQVAASINSVETLLEENKKLNERLLLIDENNRNLTQTVETELQTQIDQQVTQLNELIDLVKQAEQRRIDEDSKSIMAMLTSNTGIILISSALTLLVLVGFGVFLLRRSGPNETAKDTPEKTKDIVDDDLVIGELDDELDADSDDLLAALEQDTAGQDDDILSDELEDDDAISSLSDDELGADFGLEDELEDQLNAAAGIDEDTATDFVDIEDDMLVPDSLSNQPEEHDFDADAISLDDSEDNEDSDDGEDAISLDDEPVTNDSNTIEDQSGSITEELDLSDDEDGIDPELSAENPFDLEDEGADDDDGTPKGIGLDEHGEIDEDTLDQIEEKIQEKDQTINRLADEILEELDVAPEQGLASDDNKAEASNAAQTPNEEAAGENTQSVDDADIDALLDGVDEAIDIDSDAYSPSNSDQASVDEITDLSDELLAELEDDEQVKDDLDSLLEDEDLVGLDETDDLEIPEEENLSTDDDDVVSSDDINEFDMEEAIDMAADSDNFEEMDDQVSALADELLQELENETETSDELDSLLEDLGEDSGESDDSGEDESEVENNKTSVEQDGIDDFLEEVPEELIENTESHTSTSLDSDDLLDDIPSFTSAVNDDEDEDELADDQAPIEAEEPPSLGELSDVDAISDDEQLASSPITGENTDEEALPKSESENKNKGFEAEPSAKDGLSNTQIPDEDTINTANDAQMDAELDSEDEQDVLSSLPDLDGWLDEDEPDAERQNDLSESAAADKLDDIDTSALEDDGIDANLDLSALELDDDDLAEISLGDDLGESGFDKLNELDSFDDSADDSDIDASSDFESDEEDLINGLDDVNFDDMLSDLADSDDEENESDAANARLRDKDGSGQKGDQEAKPTLTDTDNTLEHAGLDIDALMTDVDIARMDDESDEGFVDVNDLLKESDGMSEMLDSDIDLDLESSLDQLVGTSGNEDYSAEGSSEPISDEENDQASNLDLAQVYIDMEDTEAAKELLEEVMRKGTISQIEEAESLLAGL